MPTFIITRADGGVSIKDAAPEMMAHAFAQWKQTANPEWLPATIAPAGPLPSKRFRDAWRADPVAGVRVDLDAAKALIEAEIPFRGKANAAKVGRVRAGVTKAKTATELEAVVTAEGWKTAIVARPADAGAADGEDL